MAALSHSASHTSLAHAASNSSLQRKPTKKSSFLSLKRDKKSDQANANGHTHTGPGSISPSSFHAFDLETSPRSHISRPYELGGRRSCSGSKSATSTKDLKGSRTGREQSDGGDLKEKERVEFPVDSAGGIQWPSSSTRTVSKAHSHTSSGAQSHPGWDQHLSGDKYLRYPFRDSEFSMLSQFDSPPRTPVDDMSFRGSISDVSVVVAAPVAGVETMDALVDGMNGFSGEDPLAGLSSRMSRSKSLKMSYHPLYHPPLPIPPPGVTLGGAMPRRSHRHANGKYHSKSSSGDANHRPRPSRAGSNNTVTRSGALISMYSVASASTSSSPEPQSSRDDLPSFRNSFTSSEVSFDLPQPSTSIQPKTVAPSISEIIRAHAPAIQQTSARSGLSRKGSFTTTSQGSCYYDAHESPPDYDPTEDADIVSRSSVDTIAEEVRQTLLNQKRSPVLSPVIQQRQPLTPKSRPQSAGTDYFRSSQSDGRRDSSLCNFSIISDQPPLPPIDFSTLTKTSANSSSQAIAQYLRSSRLTTIFPLIRPPHASREHPLNVSFSDLGSPTGSPLVVFLGLGCVRHIMGLYDEMAECLGLRLITIDRWGLGRTDLPRSKLAKGIPEWASVVEEVLNRLNIDQCSVMAHSAGAPYALAFANRFPERIRGDICLLAPWVGGGEGASYKWLKYVPNGILKTAQAAEWKIQAWMLGKPPSLAYEGIGFDLKSSTPPTRANQLVTSPTTSLPDMSSSTLEYNGRRPSVSSGRFSDYDDLRDFEGRFESRSTLGRYSVSSGRSRKISESAPQSPTTRRKPSKGFLGRFKGGNGNSASQSQEKEKEKEERLRSSSGKKLKALRSMGSLKSRPPSGASGALKKTPQTATIPLLPPQVADVSPDGIESPRSAATSVKDVKSNDLPLGLTIDIAAAQARAGRRRSISFSTNTAKSSPIRSPVPPVPPIPYLHASSQSQTSPSTPGSSYQAALGNALIAASHAESAKGTHGDLVQILNHDRQPWGFSYSAYPHSVRVWYGDRDEKIAENAVRWMENTMGPDKCVVRVVKGGDHSLMLKSSVVVDVLEYISDCWQIGLS